MINFYTRSLQASLSCLLGTVTAGTLGSQGQHRNNTGRTETVCGYHIGASTTRRRLPWDLEIWPKEQKSAGSLGEEVAQAVHPTHRAMLGLVATG